jgi:hypothetical protein
LPFGHHIERARFCPRKFLLKYVEALLLQASYGFYSQLHFVAPLP